MCCIRPGVPRQARLRSNPSNLSGSFQRREPPRDESSTISAKSRNVAIIGAGVVGLGIAWRLAGRATVDGVRPRHGRGGREPRGRRHAGGLLRGRARRGGAGRARPRQPGALAGLRRRAAAGESGIDVELRAEGTLVRRAHRRRSGAARSSSGVPAEARPAAGMDFGRRHAAARAASRRQARRRGVQAAGSSGRQPQAGCRRCASPPKRPARQSASISRSRRSRRARRPATASCSPTARPSAADVVVLAAGAWSRGIAGLPPDLRPPVRPIKGQMLALRMDPAAPLITHVIWAPGVYLVPRRDGRLIVGATVEEKGFDDTHHRRRRADAAGSGVARGAGDRGTADRRDVGRPSAGQPRRCADPRPGSARRLDLCHRPSPQRHPADAGDGRRDRAARARRHVVEPAIRPFGIERFAPARAAE